jgi:hypothetical protein
MLFNNVYALPKICNEDRSCPICLEIFSGDVNNNNAPVRLPCEHFLCFQCAKKMKESSCPLCRKIFDAKNCFRMDLEAAEYLMRTKSGDVLSRPKKVDYIVLDPSIVISGALCNKCTDVVLKKKLVSSPESKLAPLVNIDPNDNGPRPVKERQNTSHITISSSDDNKTTTTTATTTFTSSNDGGSWAVSVINGGAQQQYQSNRLVLLAEQQKQPPPLLPHQQPTKKRTRCVICLGAPTPTNGNYLNKIINVVDSSDSEDNGIEKSCSKKEDTKKRRKPHTRGEKKKRNRKSKKEGKEEDEDDVEDDLEDDSDYWFKK